MKLNIFLILSITFFTTQVHSSSFRFEEDDLSPSNDFNNNQVSNAPQVKGSVEDLSTLDSEGNIIPKPQISPRRLPSISNSSINNSSIGNLTPYNPNTPLRSFTPKESYTSLTPISHPVPTECAYVFHAAQERRRKSLHLSDLQS